jgi:glutathione S-transferase
VDLLAVAGRDTCAASREIAFLRSIPQKRETDLAYTLVIGTKNWSSWSLRAWLALKAAGIPFEERLIALRRPDSAARIEKLSPSARIPVLYIRNGESESIVFDSLAICETIAERHPEAGLWPDDPEARGLARSYAAEMHSGFLAFREALPMDFARELTPPPLGDTVQRQIRRIQSAWHSALSRYGTEGGFLFGRFSIADCMYAPVVSRFLTYAIPMSDDVDRYARKMMALPAMQEWLIGARQEIEDGLPDQWVVDMVRNAR